MLRYTDLSVKPWRSSVGDLSDKSAKMLLSEGFNNLGEQVWASIH